MDMPSLVFSNLFTAMRDVPSRSTRAHKWYLEVRLLIKLYHKIFLDSLLLGYIFIFIVLKWGLQPILTSQHATILPEKA
jgi:fatty-acid desaturase